MLFFPSRSFGPLSTLATLAALALFAVGGSALVAACSSSPATPTPGGGTSDDGGGCQAFVPPASFDPTSPTSSFIQDVYPIFQTSCAFTSCHGSSTSPAGGMYLGADPAALYANIVGVASTEYPSMERVTPSNPASSYLLYRIDGDACSLAGCTSVACAELMPQGNPTTLPQAQLLTIRAWVAQGAVNDIGDAGVPVDAGNPSDAGDGAAPSDGATDASGD